MKYLKVLLWGKEIGRLVWERSNNTTYFMFNPKNIQRPDFAPLMYPLHKWNISVPAYGESKRIYQGLPPFIADSLPDSWGNKLFDKWIKQNRISRNKITPLYKLMFIGRRGMGALEYEPAAEELEHPHKVDINSLYNLSLEILEERESVVIDTNEELTLRALLAVGTSAGGRQMKAIIAINPLTKEIRSGQIDGLAGFDYHIIKFEDKIVPTSEIEIAYHDMAVAAGIEMEDCSTITIEGVTHFITRRFDRKNGEKIHMQTLAAINPDADSYEDLIATCRNLNLADSEITEVYRRLVFNVMAHNTDDHNKNFSFLLEKGGKWRLAPAYDLTFIFNQYGTGPESNRCLSLYGNTGDISKEDLIEFAKDNSIRNPETIISKVGDALMLFSELADKYNIPFKWRHIIQMTIQENLSKFGYTPPIKQCYEFTDSVGRRFTDVSISMNRKGLYCIVATINGNQHKRFIKPDSESFVLLQLYEEGKINEPEGIRLMEKLFSIK